MSAPGLFNWVKNRIAPYNVPFDNLTSSMGDGMVLCALLHSYYPDVIPLPSMSKTHKKFNLDLAIREAEFVGIPRLLDAEDIFMYRVPEEKTMLLLLSEWYRYLEKLNEAEDAERNVELDEEVMAKVAEEKRLRAKFLEERCAERPQRIQQALSALDELKASSICCCRCGDMLSLEADESHEAHGKHFHSACFRCHSCGTKLSESVVQYDDAWCEPCQMRAEIRAKAESGDSGEVALSEEALLRQAELDAMKSSMQEKGNPFADMERARDEERRRRAEQRAAPVKELTPEELAKQQKLKEEMAEMKRQEREAAKARREAEAAMAAEREAKMEELRANAVRTEDITDVDALKQKRESEMEAIKAERQGANPFKEMERKQQEERQRRFGALAGASSGSEEAQQRAKEVEVKRVSANPFADMEKKKEEERQARLSRVSGDAPAVSERAKDLTQAKRVTLNPFAEMERKKQEEKQARLRRFQASASGSPSEEAKPEPASEAVVEAAQEELAPAQEPVVEEAEPVIDAEEEKAPQAPIVIEEPVVEESEPVRELEPVAEEPEPVQEPEPVVEEPEPVIDAEEEKAPQAPVAVEEPVLEEPEPALEPESVQEPEPVVEETEPTIEPEEVVEPVAEEPEPVQEPEPVTEEIEPVLEPEEDAPQAPVEVEEPVAAQPEITEEPTTSEEVEREEEAEEPQVEQQAEPAVAPEEAEAETEEQAEPEEAPEKPEEESTASSGSTGVVGDAVAKLAANDAALHQLSLKSRYLKTDDVVALAGALKGNSCLLTLCLADCSISTQGAEALGEALSTNPALQSLDLENNKIGSEGIAALAVGITNNTNLTELTLLGNTVPGEGAMSAFITAFETNTTLLDIKWRVSSRQSFKVNSCLTRNKEILRRIGAGMSTDDIDPQKMKERDEKIRAEHDAKFAQQQVDAPCISESVDSDALTGEQIAAEARMKRERELAAIEESRKGKGNNPFQEMERQREEERRARFARISGAEVPESSPAPKAASPSKAISSPFQELEKKAQEEKIQSLSTPAPSGSPSKSTGKLKSNPFAEMERKREEERRARFSKYSQN